MALGFVTTWEVEFKVLGWNLTLVLASTLASVLTLALASASTLILTLASTFGFVYVFSTFGYFSFEIVSL